MADGRKVRLVRCPKCENLLPENPQLSVYQCGGCGAVLRAKKKVPINDDSDGERGRWSSEKLEHLSENGSGSLGNASDVERETPRVDQRNRRTPTFPHSHSTRTQNQRTSIVDDDWRRSGGEFEGSRVKLSYSEKEVGSIDEQSRFSEYRINNWVNRYNLHENRNRLESDYSAPSLYNNPMGSWRPVDNMENWNEERIGYSSFDGISSVVADQESNPNFTYPDDNSFRPDSTEKFGQLKDQYNVRYQDVVDKPRRIVDRPMPDRFYGSPRFNGPLQASAREKPPYFHQRHESFPSPSHHYMNTHDVYPPRHAADHFQQQMTWGPHDHQPAYQNPMWPSYQHFPALYMDYIQPHHHPGCTCSQCSNNISNLPSRVPPTRYNNGMIPKDRIVSNLYGDVYSDISQPHCSNSRGRKSPISHDTRQHTRFPSDIDSNFGGFAPSKPRRVVVSQKKGHICHAIAGGSPFITCLSCFELLKLPERPFRMEKNQQRLKCGACSVVIVIKIEKKRLIVCLPSGEINGDYQEVSQFSSDDFKNSSQNLPLEDQGLKLNKSEKVQVLTSSSIFSEEEKPPSIIVPKDVPNSAELHHDSPSDCLSNHSVEKYEKEFDDDSRSGLEKIEMDKIFPKTNSVEDVSMATELEVSFDDYTNNTHLSQDSVEVSKEEGINKISKDDEESKLIEKSFENLSTSDQQVDDGTTTNQKHFVFINGHPIPGRIVEMAENRAGTILPGDYWYDYRAGFWGVIGHPCLGIIPPFIEEFNYPMPTNCSAGNTGVYVNGRELHQKDLNLLSSRGLPTTRDRFYVVEMSGRVFDVASGEELYDLGKLAPTIEKMQRGFGMKVPKTLRK